MKNRPLFAFFVAAAVLVLGACSGGADVAPQATDLSGFYFYNADASEEPSALLSMPGRPAGFGGGGMAGDAGGGIQVEQTDSTVTIDYIGGQTLRLFTDGREIRREMPNGAISTTKSSWKDGKLRIERRVAGGSGGRRPSGAMETITTVWLENDGQRLYVRTLIEGRGQPIQVTRVYDAGGGD